MLEIFQNFFDTVIMEQFYLNNNVTARLCTPCLRQKIVMII
jgi:hypothetical protein